MSSILVLCHGNVNRSPLVEAVLNHRICTEKVPDLRVVSAGFIEGGRKPPPKTRSFAAEKGLSVAEHRSLQVTEEMLRAASVIIYMDNGNWRRLRERALGMNSFILPKAVCLGWFLPFPTPAIADPGFMRGNSPEYREIMEKIYDAAGRFPLAALPKRADFPQFGDPA